MSRRSFLSRANGHLKPAHRRSKKQERELAARGGGRLVNRSGAGPEKADVKKYNQVFRIEAKTTSRKSFSVTRAMVDQLETVALAHGELPAFVIEFVDEQGRPVREVAVVPTSVLDSLNVENYKDAES